MALVTETGNPTRPGRCPTCISQEFLAAVLGGLEQGVGTAGAVLYRCGYSWGLNDLKAFAQRVQAESGLELRQMSLGAVLEAWWLPRQGQGWGSWQYDFRQAKEGLIFAALSESTARSLGPVVCSFYAGMLAAVFSGLARRQLACLEIDCLAPDAAACRFLIATPRRVRAVAGRQSPLSQQVSPEGTARVAGESKSP
jgi:predicted hydrocarbon binding protein